MIQDADYVEIYRPAGPQELMLIKMHLDANGIQYYVADENICSILPVGFPLQMRLMVARHHAARCAEMLREELGMKDVRQP